MGGKKIKKGKVRERKRKGRGKGRERESKRKGNEKKEKGKREERENEVYAYLESPVTRLELIPACNRALLFSSLSGLSLGLGGGI
ncbi:hypothetical protein [Pedobacter gandavensis]|uniref:hypothetical protein n=1 Tax=Pedobacter gandavensis TaxID=2679963 RepID=UPI00292DCAF6|nr:hypothetical protein [Pedobacter gandavensis]